MLNEIPCVDCNWECTDIPGMYQCTNCVMLKQWNRFAQAYSYYVREGYYGF